MIRAVDVVLAPKQMVESGLCLGFERWRLNGGDGSPKVQRLVAGAISRPPVTAELGRLPPVFGTAVVGEEKRITGRAARHLANLGERLRRRLPLFERRARLVAGEQRKLREIVHGPYVRRAEPRVLEAPAIEWDVRPGVLHQFPELGALQGPELVGRGSTPPPPARPLTQVQKR